MLEEMLLNFGLGFGTGYVGTVSLTAAYEFLAWGEKSFERLISKFEQKLINPKVLERTVYVGGALTLVYTILK